MKNLLLFLSWLAQIALVAQSPLTEPLSIGTSMTLYSEILQEDRVVYIHTPVGVETMENLAVVFVLDAFSQFQHTATTIDYLSAVMQGNDKLPPAIVVGITNPNRNLDLTPFQAIIAKDSTTYDNTGGGARFLDFITTELIPYIDDNYNTSPHRTLIGHSLGGLLVFQALLEKPEYFDNYLAHDPALGFGNRKFYRRILDSFKTLDLRDEYLYVSSANNRPSTMTDKEFLVDTDHFLEQMDKPNLDFRNCEARDWTIEIERKYYENEDHFSVPIVATLEAMQLFYDFYPFKPILDYFHKSYMDRTDLLARLKTHYENISTEMGTEILPSEQYINVWAWGLDVERNDLSRSLFEYNISLYPDSPEVYSSYGYSLERNGLLREALVQFEKSLTLEENPDVRESKRVLQAQLRRK